MSKLVNALIVITVLAAVSVFVAFGIAIWQPWGHGKEWRLTASLAAFVALAAGFTAGLLKDFGGRS